MTYYCKFLKSFSFYNKAKKFSAELSVMLFHKHFLEVETCSEKSCGLDHEVFGTSKNLKTFVYLDAILLRGPGTKSSKQIICHVCTLYPPANSIIVYICKHTWYCVLGQQNTNVPVRFLMKITDPDPKGTN